MTQRTYHCAVEVAMDVLGGKWATVILAHLKERPCRFSDLRRLIPGISEKMLAQRLRELTADGLIDREVVEVTPPNVLYRLSDDGRSLTPALQALHSWGEQRAADRSLRIVEAG